MSLNLFHSFLSFNHQKFMLLGLFLLFVYPLENSAGIKIIGLTSFFYFSLLRELKKFRPLLWSDQIGITFQIYLRGDQFVLRYYYFLLLINFDFLLIQNLHQYYLFLSPFVCFISMIRCYHVMKAPKIIINSFDHQ